MPVAVAGLVFLPLLADGGGVEVAFSFQAGFVEEGFGPVFEFSAERGSDGDAEAHFGAVDEAFGDVIGEDLACGWRLQMPVLSSSVGS